MAIRFSQSGNSPLLRDRNRLREFLNSICAGEKRQLKDLSVVFCSDLELLELNRIFLGHSYFTDILSFDLGNKAGEVRGELYISLDRVRENAEKFRESFDNELYRVIFHGLLHLCGYQDKTASQQKTMRGKENQYLRLYFQ
ncbi:MAG TPA: rRNA maturation RNase YbeY [Chitinophagaceae bacterium]|nr:rRNA maturation RNase YbeY [Chitinophagaceae bacterium]